MNYNSWQNSKCAYIVQLKPLNLLHWVPRARDNYLFDKQRIKSGQTRGQGRRCMSMMHSVYAPIAALVFSFDWNQSTVQRANYKNRNFEFVGYVSTYSLR